MEIENMISTFVSTFISDRIMYHPHENKSKMWYIKESLIYPIVKAKVDTIFIAFIKGEQPFIKFINSFTTLKSPDKIKQILINYISKVVVHSLSRKFEWWFSNIIDLPIDSTYIITALIENTNTSFLNHLYKISIH